MQNQKNNNKMTWAEAERKLYSMWENGQLPSNFTPGHSEFSTAVKQMMERGYIQFASYFSHSNE